MEKSLVVVESPAKANTINKFLGSNFIVKASVGHVKDLPEKELGVDIEHDFEPRYVTIRGRGKILKELKKASQDVGAIYLAPDPDREGEAIAWHVAEELKDRGIGFWSMRSRRRQYWKPSKTRANFNGASMKHSRLGEYWTGWWDIRSAPYSGKRYEGD
jgi:hypothetical protein